MERRHEKIAGALLIIGTLWMTIAIRIAEILTPGYSLRGEAISGLGSTYFSTFACMAQHCNTIYLPASFIFVASGIGIGAFLLLSSRYLSGWSARKRTARLIALMGLGTFVLSASYLPLYFWKTDAAFTTALVLHLASSIWLVAIAGLLAIRADAFTEPLLKYISRAIGAVIVIAVPVYTYMAAIDSLWGPGFGGAERIGFYIIFAWFLLYGVYLIRTPEL